MMTINEVDPDLGEDPAPLPVETLPLDGWHRAHGARMVEFAGYHMPVQYEGIVAEHLWTRSQAGLFDVSHMGQLMLRSDDSGDGGADVAAALETVLPGDLAGLGVGRMRYSLLLDASGGILDDLMVTRLPLPDGAADAPASFYMVVNGATKYDDLAHLREQLPDAVAINHLDDWALIALQGPRAVDALARIVPDVDRLGFMTAARFDWEGGVLWISRSGYTGEDGFEIAVEAARVTGLADRLAAEPEVRPVGLGARDSLRLEAGLPLYGHDLDVDTTPIMADLGFAIGRRRRGEGNFPGAERILAEHDQGAITRRVGLIVEGRQPVREGAAVVDDEGSEVGRVTSGGFSPSLSLPIAMAYVPVGMSAVGSVVQIVQRGRVHRGVVTALPFVPHRYVRRGAVR